MKKFLLGLVLSLLLISGGSGIVQSQAANTVTQIGSGTAGADGLPITIFGANPFRQKRVVIDTTGQDLTVHTPATGNMVCVLGWEVTNTLAANVKFTSGTTEIITYNLAANQMYSSLTTSSFNFCTVPGQALKIQSSAAITSLLIKLVETPYIIIRSW